MSYEYYSAKQVITILPVSQAKAREIINDLRKNFEKEYPEEYQKMVWVFGKKLVVIPRWYFNQEVIIQEKRKNII